MKADTPLDQQLNDIGNAERFSNLYWGTLAFVPESGLWRRWDLTRWRDDDDEAVRAAALISRSWFDDLVREADANRQKRLLAHAQRSCSANGLRAMIGIAKTLGLTVFQREWDADPFLLGVQTASLTSARDNRSDRIRSTASQSQSPSSIGRTQQRHCGVRSLIALWPATSP